MELSLHNPYTIIAALFLIWCGYRLWLLSISKREVKNIVGHVGMVTSSVAPGHNGKIHFTKPWMGEMDWEVTSEHQISVGKLAKVVAKKEEKLVIERYLG